MLTLNKPLEKIKNIKMPQALTSIELCAGAGGQALGLEQAGFEHLALIDNDLHACATLRQNRKKWNVIESDLRDFHAFDYKGVDLLAGGVPCPPFSIAGKQLGIGDERNLFQEVIRIAKECEPKAVMIENVKGLLNPKFDEYRRRITRSFENIGLFGSWKLLYSSDFGVPQLRPRVLFVALGREYVPYFKWPDATHSKPVTVAESLYPLMKAAGWEKADEWRKVADKPAPTLVGGSKKHGGPDLGPTRARLAWANLGIDGRGLAEKPPENGFSGMPKLTVKMAAIIQGFSSSWEFYGKKTPAYRQVGNAFPPPVAGAVGRAIADALMKKESSCPKS